MASLFTSSPVHAHGVRSIPQALPNGVLYFPEELKRHGYATAAVVSNAAVGQDFGFERGFDLWSQITDEDHNVTDKAIETLDDLNTQDDDRPFFIWVHYLKPHTPYQPSSEYHLMFVGDSLWAEEDVPFSQHQFGAYRTLPQNVNIDGNTNRHYYIAEYDAEIRNVDAEVGRFLEGLKARGLYDSSLVVLTADHGESMGEHSYYFEHGMFPYDVNGRVPLMIRIPGRHPAVTDTPASLIDLFPTLLKAVELPIPEGAYGTDLLAAVDIGDSDRMIYAESGNRHPPQVSVRYRGWKLIYLPNEADQKMLTGGPYELYNTNEDPPEEDNLIDRGYDEIQSKLTKALHEWLSTWDDASLPLTKVSPVTSETWKQLQALGYVYGNQVFSLHEHLEQAQIIAPADSHVMHTSFQIAQETRTVLYQHPNSDIIFHGLGIGSAATLELGIGINEDVWNKEGDGVLFEVIVSTSGNSQPAEETVYSRYLDPKNRPEDRRWVDEVIDLKPFANKVLSITFRTSSGPAGNDTFDWAGWSEPRLLP
jgi:arylsulfatase A-like enzyme